MTVTFISRIRSFPTRAPYSGDYYIHVRQQLYKGGRWIYYRAHVGNFMRPTLAYPLGGQARSQAAVTLLGDGLGKSSQLVTWPTETGDWAFYPGEEGEQPPSSLPLRISPFPNALEAASKRIHPVPVALNGIIASPGEEDVFEVTLEKEVSYRICAFARGNGSPLDSSVWIRHVDAEEPEATMDDATWSTKGETSDSTWLATAGTARWVDGV